MAAMQKINPPFLLTQLFEVYTPWPLFEVYTPRPLFEVYNFKSISKPVVKKAVSLKGSLQLPGNNHEKSPNPR